MRNNFRIIDVININALNCNIEDFECKNGYSPYVFMNRDTIGELIRAFVLPDNMSPESNFLCCEYMGRKVFCDNTLDYGEVELR